MRRTLHVLKGSELTGNTREGVTKMAFKLMLINALHTLEPEMQIQTDDTIKGKSVDLVLILHAHVEIIECLYVPCGMLSIVSFDKHPRRFSINCTRGNARVMAMKGRTWTDLSYKLFPETAHDRFMSKKYDETVVDDECATAAREVGKRCGCIYDAMYPSPTTYLHSMGYHVVIGIGTRVEVYEQAEVFDPTPRATRIAITGAIGEAGGE